MSKTTNSSYTRRKFLQLSGGGLAAAGMGSALQSCAPAVPSGMTLKMSWWGEQEAPG